MLNELENNTFTQEPTQPTKPEATDLAKEQNFRAMRERAEAAERGRQEAERRSSELERIIRSNMSSNQPSQKLQIADDDDDLGISDDSYIEGKDFKRYVKTLKQEVRSTRKQQEETHQMYALSLAELKLNSKYNDFSKVVNDDSLNRLKNEKPPVYRSIMSNPDIAERGETAYEFLKNDSSIDIYANENKRLEENRKKPGSAATTDAQVADTPLARIGDYDRRVLSKQQKEDIMRRVQQYKNS